MTDELVHLSLSTAQLKAEILRLHEREQHFARVLGVPDGGRYRNDWDSRLTDLLAERDRLRDVVSNLLDYADEHKDSNCHVAEGVGCLCGLDAVRERAWGSLADDEPSLLEQSEESQ